MQLSRSRRRWVFVEPLEKLAYRAQLPGANGFDLATEGFRVARSRGTPFAALLPAAMPLSWMLNARATSIVFRRWLAEPLFDVWVALVTALEGGPGAWLDRDEAGRSELVEAVRALSIEGHGLAAISKVLASLVPETALLMDDAAIALLLDRDARPADADHPLANADALAGVLDVFSRAVDAHFGTLAKLSRDHAHVALDAAQVLDRLLWVDAWGHRDMRDESGKRWVHVIDGEREGVVRSEIVAKTRAAVDLAGEVEPSLCDLARAALDEAERFE